MGQIVSASGYRLDPTNFRAVLSLKNSQASTVGEVRKLLGLLGYYRNYIPRFARTAHPLFQLLEAGPENVARPAHQALAKLLDHLTSAPVLGYPDFSHPLTLLGGLEQSYTRGKMKKCVLL